jgi:tetratricopeptide (TPR) repeat protein
MATAFTYLAATGHMRPQVAYHGARDAAQRAVRLEDGSGEAFAALGSVKLFHDWDFKEAYRHFQKALGKAPGSASVRQLYAFYLKAMGDIDAAEEELLTAIELDPLSPTLRTALGEVYLHGRRFEEAENQLRRVLDLDPEFRSAREVHGWASVVQGRFQEALDTFEEIPKRTGDPFKVIPHRAYALARLGREEDARRLGRLLVERRDREPEVSLQLDFALLHTAPGETERALDYLEEAVEERLGVVIMLLRAPVFDHVRKHRRFKALLDRIGLPAEPGMVT